MQIMGAVSFIKDIDLFRDNKVGEWSNKSIYYRDIMGGKRSPRPYEFEIDLTSANKKSSGKSNLVRI